MYQMIDCSGTLSHSRPCVNGISCSFFAFIAAQPIRTPPHIFIIQSFGRNSRCRAYCPWESIRHRSYSRVRVSCIDSIVDRDPIVVFGGSFSSSVSFHVCAVGVF